ncbi:Scramblase-domain-containing protein [Choiromyces venosus 120613-1]|uniref:Scramblase-domain-containing protein n=1 Tax=Choiromyces venosus 120613-1 TaxID=1336337 RepID=A0A3N4JZ21_9PEZI|nr:Scramblase-domain-containing protein [Choiromyces venosus 120613-1]
MLSRTLLRVRLRPPLPAAATARALSTLRSSQQPPGPRHTSIRQTRARIPYNSTTSSNAFYPPASSSPPPSETNMQTPVHIPPTILQPSHLTQTHPAASILSNSALVIQRQLEFGNLLLGFEQANKYVLMDPSGAHVGFLAEEETGIGKIMARQWLRTHRAFTAHVFDKGGREVLTFSRPFSWLRSRIGVFDPLAEGDGGRVIGEARQEWHLWRRRYDLFLYNEDGSSPVEEEKEAGGGVGGYMKQFAYIDEPFLSWDFTLLSESNQIIGSVNRNFTGFGREIFTDTGVYVLRMDAASIAQEPKHLISQTGHTAPPAGRRGMTLDERAVMLATAVSVDFDYFSRHSGHGAGVMPFDTYSSSNDVVDEVLGGVMQDPEGRSGTGRGSGSVGGGNTDTPTTATTEDGSPWEVDSQEPRSSNPTAGHDNSPSPWDGGRNIGGSNNNDGGGGGGGGSCWPFDDED